MPLIIPSTITDLKSILGKKLIIEEDVLHENLLTDKYMKNGVIDNEKVIFLGQLPRNVHILRQNIDCTAISGAFKENRIPIIIDDNNIVTEVYPVYQPP